MTTAKSRKINGLTARPNTRRKAVAPATDDAPARERILRAAFAVFTERGYVGSSTLEIATRAKVSKRELYALFGSKRSMLVACIAGRASRLRLPLQLPVPRDRESLIAMLTRFGATLLCELSHPKVVAVYRLAVQEPDVARVLDTTGREATRNALSELLGQAQSAGLVAPVDRAIIAGEFIALLWGDLQLRLLLGLSRPPAKAVMQRKARAAAEGLLALHAPRAPPQSLARQTPA